MDFRWSYPTNTAPSAHWVFEWLLLQLQRYLNLAVQFWSWAICQSIAILVPLLPKPPEPQHRALKAYRRSLAAECWIELIGHVVVQRQRSFWQCPRKKWRWKFSPNKSYAANHLTFWKHPDQNTKSGIRGIFVLQFCIPVVKLWIEMSVFQRCCWQLLATFTCRESPENLSPGEVSQGFTLYNFGQSTCKSSACPTILLFPSKS